MRHLATPPPFSLATRRRLSSCLLGVLLGLCAVGTAHAEEPDGNEEPDAGHDQAPAPLLIPGALDTRPALEERFLLPPVLLERRGQVRTRAVFPLYFERSAPEDHQRFVVPYFWRRGEELNVDVAAGVFWWMRGPGHHTLVIPPLYTHKRGTDRSHGVFPLFASRRSDDVNYTVLPPLLTYARRDKDSLHQFAGPLWRVHNKQNKWWGLFPIMWGRRGMIDSMFILPPAYFRFTDDDGKKRTNVVPPFYHTVRGEDRGWGLPPLVSRVKGPKVRKTTVPLALFHLGRIGERLQLVTPLFAYFDNDEADGYLAVTPLFQWKRGPKGNANSVAPLFFQTWDDRDKSKSLVVAPIFFHLEDPANDTLVVLPFMGRRYRVGLGRTWWFPLAARHESFEEDSGTWWIAPTFQYSHSPTSKAFNIHPLWYFKRAPERKHFALAPLYFDFRDAKKQTLKRVVTPVYFQFDNAEKQRQRRVVFPFYWEFKDAHKGTDTRAVFPFWFDVRNEPLERRSKVAFPVYWGFQRRETTHTVSLNTYTKRTDGKNGTSWRFHFLPLFSVGRQPNGKSWDILYGLAGYERRGPHRRMKLLWTPIELGN